MMTSNVSLNKHDYCSSQYANFMGLFSVFYNVRHNAIWFR